MHIIILYFFLSPLLSLSLSPSPSELDRTDRPPTVIQPPPQQQHPPSPLQPCKTPYNLTQNWPKNQQKIKLKSTKKLTQNKQKHKPNSKETQKTRFTLTQLHLDLFHLNPKNPCLGHGWHQASFQPKKPVISSCWQLDC